MHRLHPVLFYFIGKQHFYKLMQQGISYEIKKTPNIMFGVSLYTLKTTHRNFILVLLSDILEVLSHFVSIERPKT